MNLDRIRKACLALPETEETMPFDETTLVFKVAGKMFALTALDPRPEFINLKCDPEEALELRASYEAVRPGWHMSKKHWNSVHFDGSIPRDEINDMIIHSWKMVVKGMKKADRERLTNSFESNES